MRKTIPAGILSFLLIFTFCACSLFEPEHGFWRGGEDNPGTIVCEEAELAPGSLQRLDIPEDASICCGEEESVLYLTGERANETQFSGTVLHRYDRSTGESTPVADLPGLIYRYKSEKSACIIGTNLYIISQEPEIRENSILRVDLLSGKTEVLYRWQGICGQAEISSAAAGSRLILFHMDRLSEKEGNYIAEVIDPEDKEAVTLADMRGSGDDGSSILSAAAKDQDIALCVCEYEDGKKRIFIDSFHADGQRIKREQVIGPELSGKEDSGEENLPDVTDFGYAAGYYILDLFYHEKNEKTSGRIRLSWESDDGPETAAELVEAEGEMFSYIPVPGGREDAVICFGDRKERGNIIFLFDAKQQKCRRVQLPEGHDNCVHGFIGTAEGSLILLDTDPWSGLQGTSYLIPKEELSV